MNYYNEIKNKLIKNEVYKRVKDYSKNRNDLETYYEIGRLLIETQGGEEHAKYGNLLIGEYSKKLFIESNLKYSERSLRRMRQFYIMFKDENWSPMATKLTWSHYQELLILKDKNEINYYIEQCINYSLSKRQLREKIKNQEYERLSIETREKLVSNSNLEVQNLVKDPIMIKNTHKVELVRETVLKQLILEDIPSFLKELGEGFSFIDSEYKILIGSRYNFIDILLFNIKFNCYVVVELKVTELKKEHIGQIQVYMNYIDNNLRNFNQDKTIGLIVVRKDNKYIIEYSSDKRIYSVEYCLKH